MPVRVSRDSFPNRGKPLISSPRRPSHGDAPPLSLHCLKVHLHCEVDFPAASPTIRRAPRVSFPKCISGPKCLNHGFLRWIIFWFNEQPKANIAYKKRRNSAKKSGKNLQNRYEKLMSFNYTKQLDEMNDNLQRIDHQ